MKNSQTATAQYSLESTIIVAALLLLFMLLTACQQSENDGITTINGQTMGTTYSVKMVGQPTHIPSAELSQGIKKVLDSIDILMSTWRPDSELSRFNQAPVGVWIELSADTMIVLDLALAIARQSGGSFDITVAPLVNLWGFGPRDDQMDRPIDAVPDEASIQQTMLQVGYQHLLIDMDAQRAKKLADLNIDLSAIAKGYAVDKVASYLDSIELHHYLVEVGGEVRAKGRKAEDKDWIIAIESPLSNTRRAHFAVSLKNAAVATSGDYRNYFAYNGKHYSHTIDPNTGRPITHALASVTVVDDSAARADAYATALMVMGPNVGYSFAKKNGLAAYFISKHEGRFIEKHTPKFGALIGLID